MDDFKVEVRIENRESLIYIDGKLANEEELQSKASSLAVSVVGGIADNTKLFEYAKNLIDEIKKELLLNKISLEYEIDVNILKNNLKKEEKYSKIETLNKKPKKKEKLDKYTKATYGILYFIMNSYEKARFYEKKLNYLPIKEARYLANEIIYAYKYNESLVLADFLTSLTDKEALFNLAREVIKNGDDESDDLVFKDYIAVIKEYSRSQEIKRLKEMIEKESDPVKKAMYVEKIRLVKMESEVL